MSKYVVASEVLTSWNLIVVTMKYRQTSLYTYVSKKSVRYMEVFATWRFSIFRVISNINDRAKNRNLCQLALVIIDYFQ